MSDLIKTVPAPELDCSMSMNPPAAYISKSLGRLEFCTYRAIRPPAPELIMTSPHLKPPLPPLASMLPDPDMEAA